MRIEDIKSPALRKLYAELKHASSTIENDAEDALQSSTDEEEFIANWQSHLMDLYAECQHFWGELEKMKSGDRCLGEAIAMKEAGSGEDPGTSKAQGAPKEITCPECGKIIKELQYTEKGYISIPDHEERPGKLDFPEKVYQCPECRAEIDYEYLHEKGVA